jgi:hypothetical protein
MFAGLRRHLTYANVVSSICLFILLGGAAYAATALGRNSVGSSQLRNNAVSSVKVKDRSLLAKDFKSGQLPRGANGTTNLTVRTGTASIPTTCTGTGACSGPLTTSSVSCHSGERATGGGYDISSASNGQPNLGASKPSPVSGAPTGWAVSAGATNAGGPSSPAGPGPTVTFPIYVVCAAR